MEAIAGCIIRKDNKTLMVKEAKKSCYGQWLEESINYNKNEILDVQWIEIEEIKNMKLEQLRDYDMTIKAIEYIENNKVYSLEILENI